MPIWGWIGYSIRSIGGMKPALGEYVQVVRSISIIGRSPVMPSFADLQSRFAQPISLPEIRSEGFEEVLVCDSRASMTPTQMVDQKLRNALQFGSVTSASFDAARRQKPR